MSVPPPLREEYDSVHGDFSVRRCEPSYEWCAVLILVEDGAHVFKERVLETISGDLDEDGENGCLRLEVRLIKILHDERLVQLHGEDLSEVGCIVAQIAEDSNAVLRDLEVHVVLREDGYRSQRT